MVIHTLGKARESLTAKSEEYKRLIREYLESEGFGQISDSYVEGHLMDMIMVNPHASLEREYWMECKATTISHNNKQFILELISYLLEWWQQKDRKDILVRLYAQKIANKKEFEKILSKKHGKNLIPPWIYEVKKDMDQEKLELLNKIDDKTIVDFFQNLNIYEVDVEFLRRATKENIKRNKYSLQRYAEALLLQTKRRSQPIKERTTLILNLLEVTHPDQIYRATTKLKKKDDIHKRYNTEKIEVPPFTYFPEKRQISSFCPFEKTNPLVDIIDENSKITVSLKQGEANQQNMHSILNQHLRRLFWKKGLTRISDTNVYYFRLFSHFRMTSSSSL